MSSITEAAVSEIGGQSDGRVSPRASAGRLFSIAAEIDRLLENIPAATTGAEEAECLQRDAEALAALARFAGERYLAALNLAKYQLTSFPAALAAAKHHLRWARTHWQRLASVADQHYAPFLDTLRMRTQAFRWESQLALIDGDLARLNALEQEWDSRGLAKLKGRLTHLPGRDEEMRTFVPAAAAWPVQWRESSYESITTDHRRALRIRGGRLGFDVEDLVLHNDDADVAITLTYWDPGPGTQGRITVDYDGADRPFGDLVSVAVAELGHERGWHHATVKLDRARFAGGGPGYADFVLTASDGVEVTVEPPALSITRAPGPHLDLHVADALHRPPSRASIHWRRSGAEWQVATLTAGIGEPDVEIVPRGRELYRFAIPDGIDSIEYFFNAEWPDETQRLPAGDDVYRWQRSGEIAPPAIVSEPLAATPRREGPLRLSARVTDPSGVARVRLFFKPIPSQKNWQSVDMTAGAAGDDFEATVPLTSEGLLYRFVAWGQRGNATTYPNFQIETPYRVIPSWDVTAPHGAAAK